jgi:zinc D-Ala-D-Ala carboxypeptidase
MPEHQTEPAAVPLMRRRTMLRTIAATSIGAGLASAGLLGTPFAAASPRELRAGLSGTDVLELQIRVAGWAADKPGQAFLAINGTFDAATAAAVRRFQLAHGLPADGVVSPATHERLDAMTAPNGSTAHFGWDQFTSPDGSGFAGGKVDEDTVKENVRRLMYKLEALRHKLDGRDVAVLSGFHSTDHQARIRASATSLHPLGAAADIAVAGLTTYAVYRVAQTCGFSGLGVYTQSWLHCDSRTEHGPRTWSWDSGMI